MNFIFVEKLKFSGNLMVFIFIIQNIFSNFVTISLYNCIFNVKLNYSFNFSIFIINNYLDNLFFDNIKRFSLDISKLNTYKELLEKLNNL